MRFTVMYLNLGAAGLIVALVLVGLALCGLIVTCRFVFAYLKHARTLNAVRTAAGGASQLKGKKLGAGLMLAMTAAVCLPP